MKINQKKKKGRPKIEDSIRRDVEVKIRLTQDEADSTTDAAAKEKITRVEWIRRAIREKLRRT